MTDFMTSEEVAQRLGVTREHISRMAKDGRIPFVRRGRLLLVPRVAWERFLENQNEMALSALKNEDASHATAA